MFQDLFCRLQGFKGSATSEEQVGHFSLRRFTVPCGETPHQNVFLIIFISQLDVSRGLVIWRFGNPFGNKGRYLVRS
jgi:hypothetical protein